MSETPHFGVPAGAPLVSVVIAAYNAGPYLSETLESVFAQSYREFEVIVVDDGSTDETRERALAFGTDLTLIERDHEGLGPARNAGLAWATGDYIAFLDADDLWHPDTLRTQVGVALAHPASGLIVCDGIEFDGDRVLRERLFDDRLTDALDRAPGATLTGDMYRSFCEANLIACPAQVLVARRAIDVTGDVCTTPNGPQDYDYYLRVSREFPATFHGESLVRWRFHSDSTSGAALHRDLRWSVWALPILEREERRCAPGEREMLKAAITRRARLSLADAIGLRLSGSIPDPDYLATIFRLAPDDATVRTARTAFALPRPLDRLALQGGRISRRTGQILGRAFRSAPTSERPTAGGASRVPIGAAAATYPASTNDSVAHHSR